MVDWDPTHFPSETVSVGAFAVVLEMPPRFTKEALSNHAALGYVVSVLVTPGALRRLSSRLKSVGFVDCDNRSVDYSDRQHPFIGDVGSDTCEDAAVGVSAGEAVHTLFSRHAFLVVPTL